MQNVKGRYSEVVATAALLANGYQVMEPTSPDIYDLGVTRKEWGNYYLRVQVKSARHRVKDGCEWIVVNATRNNRQIYTKDEVDAFIGVYDGVAYMFRNKEQSEYWCKPAELGEKWARLDASIENLKEVI